MIYSPKQLISIYKPCFLLLISILFIGCALKKTDSRHKDPNRSPNQVYDTPSKEMEFEKPWNPAQRNSKKQNLKKFEKHFSTPLALDSLLSKNDSIIESKTVASAKVNTASPIKKSSSSDEKTKKYHFRIQLLAVADLETAQKKKHYYSRLLGAPVNLLFDAPFYKLRFGHYKSQKAATEKVLDLQELGVQGFVIKE